MNIDRSVLDQLSKEQILFSTTLLERVFINQEQGISLSDQVEIDAVVIILKSSKVDRFTGALFSSFSQK